VRSGQDEIKSTDGNSAEIKNDRVLFWLSDAMIQGEVTDVRLSDNVMV
jgi:hypothetical protein